MENFNNNIDNQNFQGDENFENNSGDILKDNGNNFSIPDEYKDKGWAKFFDGKTGDELKNEVFKSYDNSQTLVGKKVEDYISTTDLKSLPNYEQIKDILIKQIAPSMNIPENIEDYSFNDVLKDEEGNLQYEYPKEVFDTFGAKFKELGISKEQGQGILKAYTDFEIKEFEKHTNADELEKSINQLFNGNQEQRRRSEALLKEFLPTEAQQYLQKTAPNQTIIMFYQVAKGLDDKYEYKEGTSNANNPSTNVMTKEDRDNEYNRIVEKMEELSKRPHTDDEKRQYQDQLYELFK